MLAFLAEPVPSFRFVGRERFTRSGERNQYSLRRESRGSGPDAYAPTDLSRQQEANSADSLRDECTHWGAIACWRARKMYFPNLAGRGFG